MNKYMIKMLADMISNLKPEQFHMEYWISSVEIDDDTFLYNVMYNGEPCYLAVNDCGTAGCIAGWANVLTSNLKLEIRDTFDIPTNAYKILGLSENEGNQLFYSGRKSIWSRYMDELGFCVDTEYPLTFDIEKEHAVQALNMIANGEIQFLSQSDYDEG